MDRLNETFKPLDILSKHINTDEKAQELVDAFKGVTAGRRKWDSHKTVAINALIVAGVVCGAGFVLEATWDRLSARTPASPPSVSVTIPQTNH